MANQTAGFATALTLMAGQTQRNRDSTRRAGYTTTRFLLSFAVFTWILPYVIHWVRFNGLAAGIADKNVVNCQGFEAKMARRKTSSGGRLQNTLIILRSLLLKILSLHWKTFRC